MLFFVSFVRPSTVHNSQHVRLMFDTESQLFLTHGQGFGLDSNDGGSHAAGYYDGFRGLVIEVRDQSSPAHEAQERKSVKKVHTFRLRDINQKKRKAFCEQLLPRLKLGKARVLLKCRPGIDLRSIVFTDEKFFRLEQDDRKQRFGCVLHQWRTLSLTRSSV